MSAASRNGNRLTQADPPHPYRQLFTLTTFQQTACSSSVTRIVSILSRFIGIITPMNRNPPYTEASVTKQEKTALNMARFIRSQTLTLLENSTNWTQMNRPIFVNHFTTTPTSFTAAASHASGMTVKTSDTYSSRRRSLLVCERMPGADKPVRARQAVDLAGVGAQP